ncbi:hypothetical protein CCR97_18455 [Rhodoplanes elegans]|uniref:Uncharacterized protein n=1 Tax=Rhodoplanes elegans TaxID=29408 RepID=A0A327KTU4_9BRAD|nr:hypothetical protein [Rhodoplanes elegans]RAI42249.1 hypothetical protein CH338_00395 [Rhodoplanes elegans]
MATAVALRTDFSVADLRRLAAASKNANQSRRQLSLAAAGDGMNRTEAARIGGMERQTLRDWVHRFNTHGPDGLMDIPSPGPSSRLTTAQLVELAEIVGVPPLSVNGPRNLPTLGRAKFPTLAGVVISRWGDRSLRSWAAERLALRRERAAPLVADLEIWMRAERARLSRHSDVAKAMDYMLKRWIAFTRFLDDGQICLTNNATERALRGIALGRKSWLFAGSDRGCERAALMYTLIQAARLNEVDPQAWLADVLARINDQAIRDLAALLPWNYTPAPTSLAA